MKLIKCLMAALLIVALAALPALAQDQQQEMPDKTFKIIKEYPRTPAKSQGWTGTCWCFSALSFIETELMRQGKPEYELSEMFIVHRIYLEKGKTYVRMHGNNTFDQGALWHDALWVIKNFGVVRDSDYTGLWDYEDGHRHGELREVLKGYLDGVIGTQRGGPSPKWFGGFKAMVASYLGALPETIEVDGKQMTPKEFADEVLQIDTDDYVEVTSFSHMPFWRQVELLVPDNWSHNDECYNVPIDDFMAIIKHALMNGYTVCYGGDTSERSISREKAYAIWEEGKPVTQEDREAMWDNWTTSDDHGMHMVGIAEDEEGNTYFLTKNSHGNRPPYDGHLYMSVNYVRAKADSILLHKDGIPPEIREKMGIK